MCGLFGWTLRHNVSASSRVRAYRTLAGSNDRRGGHSYGAHLLDERIIYRGLGLMSRAAWPKHEAWPTRAARLIAHTRYATHGNITRANAHPFVVGNITGAHNGVIFNHEALNKTHGRDFEVDSKHIFAHLDEGKSLEDLTGYGTITYTDAAVPDSVFIGTFGGDIAVARLCYGNGVVWSSDEKHLMAALRAAGWAHEMLAITDGMLYYVRDLDIYETGRTLDVQQGWTSQSKSLTSGFDTTWTNGNGDWSEWEHAMGLVDDDSDVTTADTPDDGDADWRYSWEGDGK